MSIKRIGAYWYAEKWEDYDAAAGKWHTDLSMMIVPKIAERVMLYGEDPMQLLKAHTDPFDFMIRQKVQGKQVCYIGDKETQRTCRFYVSNQGERMKVVHPPAGPAGAYKRKPKLTDKFYEDVIKEVGYYTWDARINVGKAGKPDTQTKYDERVIDVVSGFKVKECCDAGKFNFADIDYNFYLEEINKLIIKG